MKSFQLALATIFAASPALAAVKELWWNLTFVEDVNPDGLFGRKAVGVNGTWPSVFHAFCSMFIC